MQNLPPANIIMLGAPNWNGSIGRSGERYPEALPVGDNINPAIGTWELLELIAKKQEPAVHHHHAHDVGMLIPGPNY